MLAPGIFHTKSLTPSKGKIAIHKLLTEKGFGITSLDEEGALNDHGYDSFAKARYSEDMIEQTQAVFGWGTEDTETLKKYYPKQAHKIYKTGSPRADLWRKTFSDYWNSPSTLPKKPFLLISCNTGYANNVRTFGDLIEMENERGRFKRDSKYLETRIGRTYEDYKKIIEYINAIRYLSINNNDYQIVLRPHPAEDINAWKIMLQDIPNVQVIHDGPINVWIKHAFAVMHNSCSSALETIIQNKPLVTYIPYEQNYNPTLSNELGYQVKTQEELKKKINEIFKNKNSETKIKERQILPSVITKKIFIDDKLSAERIINIWEKTSERNFSNASNIKKYKALLNYDRLKNKFKKLIKKVLTTKAVSKIITKGKFQALSQEDISVRIKKFQHILNIKEKLECEVLSDKTLIIKKIEKH
jgi:surface carbohydrate biosynthesis protein